MKILVVYNLLDKVNINYVNELKAHLEKDNTVILFGESLRFNESLLDGVDVVYFLSRGKTARNINNAANKKQIAIASFFPDGLKRHHKKLWRSFYHYADVIHYVGEKTKGDYEAHVGPTNSYIISLDEFTRIEKMLKEAINVRDYKAKTGIHHRIIYYQNILTDDFAGTRIEQKKIDKDYVYVHKSIFYRFIAFVLYHLVAQPLVFIACKLKRRVRVKNPQVLKKLKKTGFFLYGNHTSKFDAVTPQSCVSTKKRVYIVANPDATSIPGIRTLVNMFGCIPLPSDPASGNKYLEAITYRIKQKKAIVIYPEAHIWPFFTGIRPFGDASFRYPAELNTPVVAMVTTYRKSGSKRKPFIDITLSEPIYPQHEFSLKENMKYLHDQVYEFMLKVTNSTPDVGYINYLQASHDSAKFNK